MKNLLNYYRECFSLIDTIHFNSELTRHEYEKILGENIGKTVSITHSGIADNRVIKTFSDTGLICGFIGNDTPYKGLQILSHAIEGLDIDVMVWGGEKKEKGRIHFRGKFNKEELGAVYQELDVLIVPSIWKETFSLVTLEALSYGVPVIVSDNVGAQDLIKNYDSSFVFHNGEELRLLLSNLVDNKAKLIAFNKSIMDKPWKHSMADHAKEIIEKIYQG